MERQLLIQDDIMDHSLDRWGIPCWHTREDVGLTALNDCVGIIQFCYNLLSRYFSDDSYYLPIVHEFWNFSFTLALGFMMELEGTRDFRRGFLDRYTMDWFKIHTMRKTAPAFILPTQAGIHLAKKFDERVNKIIRDIQYECAYIFNAQVRNSFPQLTSLNFVFYYFAISITSFHKKNLNHT